MNSQLNDEVFDIVLKHALIEIENLKIEENEKVYSRVKKNTVDVDTSIDMSKKRKKLLKKLKSQAINNQIVKLEFKFAACFFLIITIGFTVLITNVGAAKSRLMPFLYEIFDTNFEITVLSNNEQILLSNIEDNWDYIYYPKNPPQDYSLSDVESGNDFCYLSFKNTEGKELSLSEFKLGPNTTIDIDIEDADITNMTIEDKQVIFIKKYGKCHTAFIYDNIYFSIVSEGVTDEEIVLFIEDFQVINIKT